MTFDNIDKSTDEPLYDIPYAVPVPLVFYMFSDNVNKETDTLPVLVFSVLKDLRQPGIECLFRLLGSAFYDVVSVNGLFIITPLLSCSI